MSQRLRTLIVSCRGMGASHAGTVESLPEDFELVAGCDLNIDVLQEFASKHPGVKTYTDYATALNEVRPDVVVNATGNVAHAPLTIQAAQTEFVKGIYVEKPIAVGYGDAKAMLKACEQNGVYLACNHQRRMMPIFRKMRELLEHGAIGEPELIICYNAGDFLSDGTHFVDTVRHLSGDSEVKWVLGQLYRKQPKPEEPRGMGFQASGGWRYGHVVESGGFAVIQFANGLRAEVHHGELIMKGKFYQHYEVLGTKGRLIRPNDNGVPNLLIQDGSGGPRPVEYEVDPDGKVAHRNLMQESFRRFAACVRNKGNAYVPMYDGDTPKEVAHPLGSQSAIKTHEVVMAIYESARTHQRIELPLQQDAFPLELMLK